MAVVIYWMPNPRLKLFLSLSKDGAIWEAGPAAATIFKDELSARGTLEFLQEKTRIFGVGMSRFTGCLIIEGGLQDEPQRTLD